MTPLGMEQYKRTKISTKLTNADTELRPGDPTPGLELLVDEDPQGEDGEDALLLSMAMKDKQEKD